MHAEASKVLNGSTLTDDDVVIIKNLVKVSVTVDMTA